MSNKVKLLQMPLEEYEKDLVTAKEKGFTEGIKHERDRLQPLMNYLWNLTGIKVYPDGREEFEYLECHPKLTPEELLMKVRFIMKQVGEFH